MVLLKPLLIVAAFLISVCAGVSVQGTVENGGKEGTGPARPGFELEAVVRGAVEDQSWIYSKTREDLSSALSRYYGGLLLEDLVCRSWEFVRRPTDWYSTASLKEIRVLYDDGKRAVVEAVISIEDVDAGHNETGKGLFAMLRTPGGWRVYYASYSWKSWPGSGDVCYNVECSGTGTGGLR